MIKFIKYHEILGKQLTKGENNIRRDRVGNLIIF